MVSQSFSTYDVGDYYLPDDATEQARLNHQHETVKVNLNGKLGLAPVQNLVNVLDVATGTGIWAMQYGKQHPESNVLGMDLAMAKPTSYPSNCEFIHFDAEYDQWAFDRTFDYVHLGHVVSCFDNTKSVMRTIFDNMTPGGWIEFHDSGVHYITVDDTVTGTAIEEWALLARKGSKAVGRDLTKPKSYPIWLREVGFENITAIRASQASNTWPTDPKQKRVGAMYQKVLLKLIDSLTTFLLLAGLSAEEADDLKKRAKEDVMNPDIHFAKPLDIIYAQKPLISRKKAAKYDPPTLSIDMLQSGTEESHLTTLVDERRGPRAAPITVA